MNLDEKMKLLDKDMEPDSRLKTRTLLHMEYDAGKEDNTRKYRSRRLAPAAVLLAVVLLIGSAVGAYAAGLLPGLTEIFSKHFGSEESQKEIIEERAYPVSVSTTNAGFIVSAEAVMVDKDLVTVLLTLKRENGEPIVPAESELPFNTIVFAGSSMGDFTKLSSAEQREGSFSGLEDFKPGDTEAHFYKYFLIYKEDAPSELTLSLYNLEAWYLKEEPREGKVVELAPPEEGWKLTVPIASGDSRTLAENVEFTDGRETYCLNGLRVSPMSLMAEYTVVSKTISNHAEWVYEEKDGETKLSGIEFKPDDFWENIRLVLRLKDGTEIDMTTSMKGGVLNMMGLIDIDEEGDCYILHMGGGLPRIIPYEDMDCVIFNGTVYPVN